MARISTRGWADWLRKLVGKPRTIRTSARRLEIDLLEDRLAPATLTGGGIGGTVSIDLDNVGEALSIHSVGAGTYALTSNFAINAGGLVAPTTFSGGVLSMNGANAIQITDSQDGTSLSFDPSGPNHYTEFLQATLDNPGSSITFNGASTFDQDFFASATGNITSSAASSIVATASNITLTAGGNVQFDGTVAGGTGISQFSFTSGPAGFIRATNGSNQFGATVLFNGGTGGVSLVSAIGFRLGNSTSAGPLSVSTPVGTGDIFQNSGTGIAVSNGAAASIFTAGGVIDLTGPNNDFSGTVSLRNGGLSLGDTISIANTTALNLGAVSIDSGVGAGALNVRAVGSITQGSDPILTGGDATFTVDGGGVNAGGDISLLTAPNNIRGNVTIQEINTGDVRDIFLRNINPFAAFPFGTPLTTPGGINLLTLFYDNNAISLPALNIGGSLDILAGGAITQTGALITAGASTNAFTTVGNYGINLTNAGNTFAGAVTFQTPNADFTRAVNFVENGDMLLDTTQLGLASFSVTATGDIQQVTFATIEQTPGAGAVTFTTGVGGVANIAGSTGNQITGPVQFIGTSSVQFDNGNSLAAFPAVPAGLQMLTLDFINAPIVLPTLTLNVLSATGLGVYQAPGSHLTISGAGITALQGPILLNQSTNDFGSLFLSSTGLFAVAVTDVNNLIVQPSTLGSGAFTLNAGGDISQVGPITQTVNAGPVTINAGTHDINFSDAGNDWTGPLQLTANNANVADVNNLVLGTSKITGALTATAGGGNLLQAPGATLSVSGLATLSAPSNNVIITNQNTVFGGSVALNASGATLYVASAIDFAASNVFLLVVHATGQITESGPITGGSAVLDAGTASILLGTQANDFDQISLRSIGTGAVSYKDADNLAIHRLELGSGSLNITVNGAITDNGSGITQTGPGAITFSGATTINLTATAHTILGVINVTNVTGFALNNNRNIIFDSASTFGSSADVSLTAGGNITLPAGPLTLDSFQASAAKTTVTSDITANQIAFFGAVSFTSPLTLDSLGAGNFITLSGDVQTNGSLTLNVNSGSVSFGSGTWVLGNNTLTINGAGTFFIGGVFVMSGGTVNAPGTDVVVNSGGTLQVGTSAAAEIGTIANAGGDLSFNSGANFVVGLGAPNDELIKQSNPDDVISIDGNARLRSFSGVATFGTVLDAGAGTLTGRFAGSVDGSGARDFLAGSDIVRPVYIASQLDLSSGGTVSPTGVVTGFQADGDKYTVSASTAAVAQLVVITNLAGQIDVVVRNAAVAMTLTIATTKFSGDGFTEVGGIGVDGAADVTIAAATANLRGDLIVQNRLVGARVHDFTGGGSLRAGGLNSQTTALAGNHFDGIQIDLKTVLSALTLGDFTNFGLSSIVAERFGTITVAGFFEPRLTNRHTAGLALPAIGTVKIGGRILGTWDIAGNITSITSSESAAWTVGIHGAGSVNPDLLGNIGSFNVGSAVTTNVTAFGRIGTMSVGTWETGRFQAASFGAISITGVASEQIPGNLDNATIEATSNAGGPGFLAIGSLNVKDRLTSTTLRIDDGNIGSITVGGAMISDTFTINSTPHGGRISSLQADSITAFNLDARSLGMLKTVANPATNTLGDVNTTQIVLHGTPGVSGVALGSVVIARQLNNSTFTIEDGSLTTFQAGALSNFNLNVAGLQDGKIGSVTVQSWSGGSITALTIGSFFVRGVPGTTTFGDLVNVNINAFLAAGTAPAINSINIAGSLSLANNGFLLARNGIASFVVGRTVSGSGQSLIDVSGSSASSDLVGRIGSLLVGAWNNQNLVANTIGLMRAYGYTDLTNTAFNPVAGNVAGSTWVINGKTNTLLPKAGIGSVGIAGGWLSSNLFAPGGIDSFRMGGLLQRSTIIAENALNPAGSRIGTFQALEIFQGTIRAGSIGTFTTSPGDGLFRLSTVTVTSFTGPVTAPVGIGTVNIGSSGMDTSTFTVPGGITTFTVAGAVTNNTQIAVGFMPGGRIGALTLASLDSTRIVTGAIGTLKVQGNVSNSHFNIQGNGSGTALGTVVVNGTVSNSTFDVDAGNVASFTVGRFLSSDLLVGFRLTNDSRPDTPPGDWLGDFTIASFKTTQPFSPDDVDDTASFRDSNVIASRLMTVALTGIDPMSSVLPPPLDFGIFWRNAGGAHGVLTIGGVVQPAPNTIGKFEYFGL